jgi:hypothetical protein
MVFFLWYSSFLWRFGEVVKAHYAAGSGLTGGDVYGKGLHSRAGQGVLLPALRKPKGQSGPFGPMLSAVIL